MEGIPSEEYRKVRVEGQEGHRELVIGICITREVADAEGNPMTEYLLIQRDPPHGPWYFPGGKVEKGEKMRDALNRELKEELGIEYEGPVSEVQTGAYTVGEKELAIVNVSIPSTGVIGEPTLQAGDTVQAFAWTSDPLSYPLTEQAREILEAKVDGAPGKRVRLGNIHG